jgi:hypothetical protein
VCHGFVGFHKDQSGYQIYLSWSHRAVVSHHLGSGDQTPVLCKSSRYLLTPEPSLRPLSLLNVVCLPADCVCIPACLPPSVVLAMSDQSPGTVFSLAHGCAPPTVLLSRPMQVHKLLIVVELLLGEIPDRLQFRQPSLKRSLMPYFLLTQGKAAPTALPGACCG